MSKSKLYAALAAAQGEIHRLKKDDKNSHGGYSYVSVDDVKDHIRPILTKHGLSISVSEQSFELSQIANSKGGFTAVAVIRFAVTLRYAHGADAEETPPDIITICLPYTGAQTAGAARSYAVKEWGKASLLVSTGEKDQIVGGIDADAYAQQDYSSEKSAYQAKKEDGEDFKRIQAGLQQINREGSLDDLALFWKNNREKVAAMKVSWKKELTRLKDEIKAAFEEGSKRPLYQLTEHENETIDEETGEVTDGTGNVGQN